MQQLLLVWGLFSHCFILLLLFLSSHVWDPQIFLSHSKLTVLGWLNWSSMGPRGHRKVLLVYILSTSPRTSTTLPPSLRTSPIAAKCKLQEQMESLSCQWLEKVSKVLLGIMSDKKIKLQGARERTESLNRGSSFFSEQAEGCEQLGMLCRYLHTWLHIQLWLFLLFPKRESKTHLYAQRVWATKKF